jgi:hypothetical protein
VQLESLQVRRVNMSSKKFMTTKLSCLQQNQALNWPIGKVRSSRAAVLGRQHGCALRFLSML